ncbi:MAG TPA: hypothetical protein VHJ17_25695 [Thermomonospora sp.]|nr:hypothetical protein [Thermomonospora sp.]
MQIEILMCDHKDVYDDRTVSWEEVKEGLQRFRGKDGVIVRALGGYSYRLEVNGEVKAQYRPLNKRPAALVGKARIRV